jgi:hypothetical protein
MELERRILHGLACEWQAALENLEPPERKLIHRPLFALRDLKGQWGSWSPVKREIALSRNLVLNYPWDSIRDVLLHETAHQFAQQMGRATSETSHGPSFQRACAILGIVPIAAASYVPLQDRLQRDTSSKHDRRILRIKKLLALAESKNKHEAQAAMLKAHELVAKYNVDSLDQAFDNDLISVFIGKPALRHPKEDYFLANLLQDFYFVRGLWIFAYVMGKGKMGRVLEISGKLENIKLASYVYAFIQRYIDAQWSVYNKTQEFNRYRKSDFAVGVIEGFRSKLTAFTRRHRKVKTYRAVIRKTDTLLAQYFRYKYPHTVNIRKQVSHQNQTIVEDGKKIGKKLVITKGIKNRKSDDLRLIGM